MEQQQQQQTRQQIENFDDALMGHFTDMLKYFEEEMPQEYKEIREALIAQLTTKPEFGQALAVTPANDKEKFIKRFMYIVFIGLVVQKKKEDEEFVNVCFALCDDYLETEQYGKPKINEDLIAKIMARVDAAQFWKDETVIEPMRVAVRKCITNSTLEQRYALISFCCFFFNQFTF